MLNFIAECVKVVSVCADGFVQTPTSTFAKKEQSMSKGTRDVEKGYSTAEVVAKLRRLADCLESGDRFEIQVAGERIYVPERAEFSIEHERSATEEELEFQLRWTL